MARAGRAPAARQHEPRAEGHLPGAQSIPSQPGRFEIVCLARLVGLRKGDFAAFVVTLSAASSAAYAGADGPARFARLRKEMPVDTTGRWRVGNDRRAP